MVRSEQSDWLARPVLQILTMRCGPALVWIRLMAGGLYLDDSVDHRLTFLTQCELGKSGSQPSKLRDPFPVEQEARPRTAPGLRKEHTMPETAERPAAPDALSEEQMIWWQQGQKNREWYKENADALWSEYDGKNLLIFDGGEQVIPFDSPVALGEYLRQQPERIQLSALHCWQYPKEILCL